LGNGKPRQRNTFDDGVAPFRQALGILGIKVDDEPYDRAGLVIAPQNAEAAQLDQARERRRWTHQQPSAGGIDMDAIVADQSREKDAPVSGRLNQFER
jgi:hypothetical protein